MPIASIPAVALTPVAYFPKGYFLENLAVCSDGSALVSSLRHKELWCVPGPEPSLDAQPVIVHTSENIVMGVVEVEPDIFIVSLSDGYRRDGGEDFDRLAASLAAAGHRVLRSQPRVIAGSTGPLQDVTMEVLERGGI